MESVRSTRTFRTALPSRALHAGPATGRRRRPIPRRLTAPAHGRPLTGQAVREKFRMYAGDIVTLMPEELVDKAPTKQVHRRSPRPNYNERFSGGVRDSDGRPHGRRPRDEFKFDELLSRDYKPPRGGGARGGGGHGEGRGRHERSIREELDEIRGRKHRGDE